MACVKIDENPIKYFLRYFVVCCSTSFFAASFSILSDILQTLPVLIKFPANFRGLFVVIRILCSVDAVVFHILSLSVKVKQIFTMQNYNKFYGQPRICTKRIVLYNMEPFYS